jgi:hypothetical protein
MEEQRTQAEKADWSVPLSVKVVVTFFMLNAWVVLVLSFLSDQKTLFGLSAGLVTSMSLGLVLLTIPIVLAFWFFPHSAFVLFLYWAIRFFREQVFIFALLGMLYLIAIRAEPLSIRGGIPAMNLVVLSVMAALVPPLGTDRFPLVCLRQLFTRLEKITSRLHTVPIWALRAAAALLPIAIVYVMITLGLNASLRDYRPYSSWEDETAYWLRIRSFAHVGLNAGYNSPNELTARATFNRYGEGSPLYIYLYGSIARFVGWTPYLPILINWGLLAAAILTFTYFTRLDPPQTAVTGLIAILTWPVLSYLPLTTHETLNQAIAFILAIGFLKLLARRDRGSLLSRVLFIAFVYVAALVRLSWGLLLIPAIFYSLRGTPWSRALLAVVLGIGLYVTTILITGYLLPPETNSIFSTILESLNRGPQVLAERFADQFSQMFRARRLTTSIAVMFQIAVIIGWSVLRLVRLVQERWSMSAILQSRTVFDIYTMSTLVLTGIVFYLHAGFARTFTPSILLVCLLQVGRKDYRFLGTLLALNVVFFVLHLGPQAGASRIIRADFTTDFPEQASLQSTLEKWIFFDPAARNPWCNTLLVPLAYYDRRLTLVPPGIGISFVAEEYPIKTPLHSKYLLFDEETYARFDNQLNVRLLEPSQFGILYYNLDSGCELDP